MKKLPHLNVYTRLGPSAIHGIGVFSIKDIPKGTSVFRGDKSKIIGIERSKIAKITPDIRKLYDDFCVIKGDKYYSPDSFNNLTVSWYLNDSKRPNVRCDKNYNFFALRNIRNGEELTADYSTYCDE